MSDYPSYPIRMRLTMAVGTGPEGLWLEARKHGYLPQVPAKGGIVILGMIKNEVVADWPILAQYTEDALWDMTVEAYRVPMLLSPTGSVQIYNGEARNKVLKTLRNTGWHVKDRTADASKDDR